MHSWLFSSYASGYITILGDITSGIHSSAVTIIVTYISLSAGINAHWCVTTCSLNRFSMFFVVQGKKLLKHVVFILETLQTGLSGTTYSFVNPVLIMGYARRGTI